MPRIDFGRMQGKKSFTALPDGDYHCRVREVEECVTRNGDAMFKLTLEVIEGAHGGRRIFDNLVLSERALKRSKLVCAALGINVDGEVDLTPDLIQDRECMVSVTGEDYVDATGTTRTRNNVLFDGYRAIGSAIGGDDTGAFTGSAPY